MLTVVDQDSVADVPIGPSGRGNQTATDVERVRSVIDQVADTIGWAGDGACSSDVRTVVDAQAAVEAALRAVAARLLDSDATAVEHDRQVSALDQLRQEQVLLQEAVSARRAEAMNDVRVALDNLRRVGTVSELVAQAPVEAARLGFERCLLSKISESRWIARSAYVSGDDQLADAMIDAGNRTPRVIDARLVEYELVRQRKSLLVRDALHNDRVHPELVRLVKPEAYVVAPIIARGSVVGFIHADVGPDSNPVDEFDRDLLDAFSTGLSITLESLYYREQLDRIRLHMDGLGNLSSCLLGDGGAERPSGEPTAQLLPPSARSLLQSAGGPLDRLTRREVEVLMHMADGETNRRIAARLYVSEATVKAHVKHILRKLDAANRAEAVSRYFRSS
ncbi:MAG TPA: LuxR C-terminal-related transcriptional regulator [Jatrophihabitantaceae bacterium]|jgi:DNA-binding CsgD family transcriptional regulator